MWKVKKINLLNGISAEGNLLRAQEITSHQQAENILMQAQQQAEGILAAAQQQAADVIAEQQQNCASQFWQQADELFSGWQQQREHQQQQLVSLAGQLLAQAMAQLLSDFTPQQRFTALLQQLLRQHPRQQQATLYCATARVEQLTDWLSRQPQLAWQLTGDEQLPDDELRLETAQGELSLSWQAICQQLNATAPEKISA